MIQTVLKVLVLVVSCLLLNTAALAQSEQASNGSMLSVTGSVTVVASTGADVSVPESHAASITHIVNNPVFILTFSSQTSNGCMRL